MLFDEKQFKSRLTKVFDKNGFSSMLNLERVEKFMQLTEIMLEENEKYNLTAIKEPNKIILNHYADCASLAAVLPKGAKIADVGCGAGFPTLPVAILRPDLKILGIDSTAKRINYVNTVKDMLGLSGVTAITARAEDVGKSELRESFDVVTARAVAAMRVLCELCLPLVKVGGQMIAMKGKNAEFELSESKKAIALLGAKINATHMVRLADDDEEIIHPLIILDKKSKTPTAYPRPFAQISKKPL
ncbi:MAG: 16S rRNA (guanine(527)-N(7))-methyltransferase RsmG [Ruminococcaceae bacterium]|nr:16S rRNA (guanine(527)-N(7))-methyltransferase RsmG [Oscillospiraceae bacterium]